MALLWVNVALLYRQHLADEAFDQWLHLLRDNGVMGRQTIYCDIPWLQTSYWARRLIGKSRVTLFALHDDDVPPILELPDCPVPVSVFTAKSVSGEHLAKLQERYGIENVE
ncbi:hypothetical protein AYO47_06205 [Planctomyces sp. SCGC AG-212-M04]|nr:hypothetical protein AYO47_06205 [Planctomyces sp. SCGC AG-212-M04]